MRTTSALLFAGLLVSGNSHSGESSEAVAFQKLTKAHPKIAWSTPPVRIDIDCDGKPDYAFIAQTAKSAWVGVVRGRVNTPIAKLSFGESPASQGGLCLLPAKLEIESLDYDPTEAVGELPGFTRSRTCKSFRLTGGECDSFHFFGIRKQTSLNGGGYE
jgi:hypothetical protein